MFNKDKPLNLYLEGSKSKGNRRKEGPNPPCPHPKGPLLKTQKGALKNPEGKEFPKKSLGPQKRGG